MDINVKKISLIFSIWALFAIFSSINVLAYIDPGTGGILFNTIWPLIIAFFVAIGAFATKWFWRPIKKVYSKFFTKN